MQKLLAKCVVSKCEHDNLKNVGLTFDECVENVIPSIRLLNSLGFIIHPEKSTFLPKGNNVSRVNIN